MSTILPIGDIHNLYHFAEDIIQKQPHDKVIFVGDYFDSFNDTPELNIETAKWLKESLQKPNRIHLMGNHDFQYAIDRRHGIHCSGFSTDKYNAINSVMTKEDWARIKYFHCEQGWWFSHAGVTKDWFYHPVLGLNEQVIESRLSLDLDNLDAGIFPDSIYAACWIRGGRHPRGGILWADWRKLDLLPEIKQVVGHTVVKKVERRRSNGLPGGDLINIDTQFREYITITDGLVSFHKYNKDNDA